MNTANATLRKALEEITDELLYQIKDCEDCFCALSVLKSAILKYDAEIHIANDFFSVVYFSLLNSVMVYVARLYDKDADCISVYKCFNKCTATKELQSGFVDNQEKLDMFNTAVKNYKDFLYTHEQSSIIDLKMRRDKFYMHNDSNYCFNPSALLETAPLTFDDISELLTKAKDFCATIYKLVSEKEWVPFIRQERILEHSRDFSGLERLLSAVDFSRLNGSNR